MKTLNQFVGIICLLPLKTIRLFLANILMTVSF